MSVRETERERERKKSNRQILLIKRRINETEAAVTVESRSRHQVRR